MNRPTKNDLIREADSGNLYHEDIEGPHVSCDFIECKNSAVLEMEGVFVCIDHGFRLIECLTIKMKDDTNKRQ